MTEAQVLQSVSLDLNLPEKIIKFNYITTFTTLNLTTILEFQLYVFLGRLFSK